MILVAYGAGPEARPCPRPAPGLAIAACLGIESDRLVKHPANRIVRRRRPPATSSSSTLPCLESFAAVVPVARPAQDVAPPQIADALGEGQHGRAQPRVAAVLLASSAEASDRSALRRDTDANRGVTLRAVRFNNYGDIDVLEVVDVPRPVPGPGQVLVRVRAAGINPGEAKIREGAMHERFPATFPSGEGSDLAGVVEQAGDGVREFSPGDEVVGFTNNRASHAEYVLVEASDLVPKPARVPWEVAGSLFVVGTTAAAAVHAVGAAPGDVVAVAGAAGGVGSLAAQLARLKGARVLGIAGAADGPWLVAHDIEPVDYAGDVFARIRTTTDRIDAFIDAAGHGNVALALDLGIGPERIDTILDFAAAAQFGVKAEGSAAAANAGVLAELLALLADDRLELPIGRTFPLSQVREAFHHLDAKHGRGKIVLIP